MGDIEIEEILVGIDSSQEIANPFKIKRLFFFLILILILLLIFIFKIGYLQIIKNNFYNQLAFDNHVQLKPLTASRGLIYDHKFKPLADNIIKAEKIVRYYPAPEPFAHVIGYVNSELKAKSGLELFYDEYLNGQNGQLRLEVDSQGRTKRILTVQEPQMGNNIITNLDFDLQKKVYELLPNDKKSAAIVVDIKSGGILALVSKPSFDNNIFVNNIEIEEYEKILNNENKPFFNRAISGQYPPGSTFKIIIASAGLQERLINPYKKLDTPGKIKITNPYDPDIVYIFPDWKEHGKIDMFEALRDSSNVYFYRVGENLGWKNLKKYASSFGFNNFLGLDLAGESPGFIPKDGWLGDLYHAAIGQGDVKVTVLQMVMATTAIANNGRLFQPQLVDKIIDQDDNLIKDILPQIIKSNFISLENIGLVKKGMKLGDNFYGKTGTAQFSGNKDKYHSWFTGFSRDISVVVLVEEGGRGSSSAKPIVQEIINYYK